MESVQKLSGADSCPTPVDSEIDWLLDQLSQGLDNSNALPLISRLIEKLDAKTRTQADQCAKMKASRCNRNDTVSSPATKPFVAFSPAEQAFEARSESFSPTESTSTCCGEVRFPQDLSFQRFLEESDSDSDCPRLQASGIKAAVNRASTSADSPRQSDISDFSDALSSMSNAPSEMTEIPEEIMEVESVVSADFNASAPSHAAPSFQRVYMSGPPSEISECIEAEESDEEDVRSEASFSSEVGNHSEHDASSNAGRCDHDLKTSSVVPDDALDVVEMLLRRLRGLESRCSVLEQQCTQSREEASQTRAELFDTREELLRTQWGLSKAQVELAHTQAQLHEWQALAASSDASQSQLIESIKMGKEDADAVEVHRRLTKSVHAENFDTQVEALVAEVESEAVNEFGRTVAKEAGPILDPSETSAEKASTEVLQIVTDTQQTEMAVVETEADTAASNWVTEVVLKISHRGHIFRVRSASSELQFVKELVADTVGRKHIACELAVVASDGEKRNLSPEVWQQTLAAGPQGRSGDALIVVRLDVQDIPDSVADSKVKLGESLEEIPDFVTETTQTVVHSLEDVPDSVVGTELTLGESTDDCIERQYEFASHHEGLDVAGSVNEDNSGMSSAQRLATRISSGLWSAVSMFRARVNPSLHI